MNATMTAAAARDVSPGIFTGTWQAIMWQPDLFSPQSFVIGTLARSNDGVLAWKLMGHPVRLGDFFRPRDITRDFSFLLNLVRTALGRWQPGQPLTVPSANISFSAPQYARGASAQAVADDAFDDSVLAARTEPETLLDGRVGPDTEAVRHQVNDFLRQMTDLAFSRIVREQGETLSEHFLDVTLAPDHGAGSVISTCYRSLGIVEMKILRAASDINAYAATAKRRAKGLFILVPPDDAPLRPKERSQMERLLGEECWKLECAGFTVPRQPSSRLLAKDIHDWATPLLA